MDDIAVPAVPKQAQGGSLGRHNPFNALDEVTNTSTSTTASGAKPLTRSPSRPLSGTTTATDTTAKPPFRKPSTKPHMPHEHHVHLQTDVLGSHPSDPTRKSKKTNFFSVAITHPRKTSDQSQESRHAKGHDDVSSPRTQTNRGLWSGLRSASGSSVGAQSSRSNVGESASRETPPPVPPKPGSSSRQPPVAPPSRSGTKDSLSVPPPPYNMNDYEHAMADELEVDGRCSPLCGLPSPRLTPVGASEKGKERERAKSSEDETRRKRESARRRREEKEITSPRRVGSPAIREKDRESRMGAAPLEKVGSGSGSGASKKSLQRDSAPAAIKAKRTKHGSFDFERPMSVTGGMNMRVALRHIGERLDPLPIERSHSAKERPPAPPPKTSQQSSSLPISAGRHAKRPSVDVNASTLARHPTESSQGVHSAGRAYFNSPDFDPVSPHSSHSGHSSSWGRNAGARLQRTLHGPFRFEPAVPPIPGSPASDLRSSGGSGGAPEKAAPSKLRPDRIASKGRSLDLGLHLSWAPQKVREEAILPYGSDGRKSATTTRARARWRGGMVDEQGRLCGRAASDVAQDFKEALGDTAYETFKTCKCSVIRLVARTNEAFCVDVYRFDAHAIPLEGPSGLLCAASRLLDNAATLDERSKRTLLDRFVRFVQENQ